MKKLIGLVVLVVSVSLVAGFSAQPPAPAMPAKKAPPLIIVSLKQAQKMILDTMNKIMQGKAGKEWDKDGHAQKAMTLMTQAKAELDLSIADTNR